MTKDHDNLIELNSPYIGAGEVAGDQSDRIGMHIDRPQERLTRQFQVGNSSENVAGAHNLDSSRAVIFTSITHEHLSSAHNRRKFLRITAIATPLIMLGSCAVLNITDNDGGEGKASVEQTAPTNTQQEITVAAPTTTVEITSTETAQEPLLETITLDPSVLTFEEIDIVAPTTDVEENTIPVTAEVQQSETTAVATTIVTTTTSTTSTSIAPIATVVPEVITEIAAETVNLYESLVCKKEVDEYIVFESGWTMGEVAANCGYTLDELKSYNQHIVDFNQITAGVTRVYLGPRSETQVYEGNADSSEFDCGEQLGKWTEVYSGETPSDFLRRVITGYGYTVAQANWMLQFKLISMYGLDTGDFLANESRCAPTESAIPILFSVIPE